MTSSLMEARALRRLTELLMNRHAALPGSEEAWEAYLAQNPDHRPLARQIEQMWDDIGRLPAPELRLAKPAQPLRESTVVPLRPRRRWAVPLGIAASLAALLLARPMLPAGNNAAPAPAQKFAAGMQTRKLHLADGSTITLAPGAEVELRLTPAARTLRLARGEAYFQVTHNAARPFSVATPFGTVTDIGTAFDIRLGQRQTLVTVAEGTVRVAAQGNAAWRDVIRNQQVPLHLSADGTHAVIGAITPASGKAAGNWTSGWLRFEGAPLGQVVEEVNRHASQQLALVDVSRAQVPVYGIFKVGDVEGLLALVAAQPGIGPHALKVEGKP